MHHSDLRRRRTKLLAAASGGVVLALAGAGLATAATGTPDPTASRAAASDTLTGPLQNASKSTYLGYDPTAGKELWWDVAEKPGEVVYPAPGKTAVVTIDGWCMPIDMDPDDGNWTALRSDDPATCMSFTAAETSPGRFTFVANAPGHAGDGRFLGDGNDGGWLDLISTSQLMSFVIPEHPSVETSASGSVQDVDGGGRASVGDTVSFALEVQNTGDVPITDITVTDARGSEITCATTVAAGSTESCTTAPHTLTQADVDTGKLADSFSFASKSPAGASVTAPDAATEVALAAQPDASTTTTVAEQELVAGTTAHVTVTVENTGNVTLSDVAATVNGAAVSCDAQSLAPGQKATCALQHEVTQADVDAGTVTFTTAATATAPNGTDAPVAGSSAHLDVAAAPGTALDLVTSVAGANKPGVGDHVALEVTASNTGNVTLRDVSAKITDHTGFTVDCPQGAIAPGESESCTVDGIYTVTQADVDAGHVAFTAESSATAPDATVVRATASAEQATEAAAPAIAEGITATLQPAADRPAAGDQVAVSVRVRNTGNVTLRDVAAQLGATTAATCPAGVLAPDAIVDCTLPSQTLTQEQVDAGSVVLQAQAAATAPSGSVVDASAETTVQIERTTDAHLTVSAHLAESEHEVPVAGDTIVGSATVTNTGNTTLRTTELTLDGTAIDCPAVALAPGEHTECALPDHAVTQEEIESGSVPFAVTGAVSSDHQDVQIADEVTVGLTAATGLDLAAEWEPSRSGTLRPDDTITATFHVTNTSNLVLRSLVLAGEGSEGATCADTELAPGASTDCRSERTVTDADGAAGTVSYDVHAAATAARADGEVTQEETAQASPSTVARTAASVDAAAKAVPVRSADVRKAFTAEPTPPAPIVPELAFTGSDVLMVGLPVAIVLVLAAIVLWLVLARRRRTTDEQ